MFAENQIFHPLSTSQVAAGVFFHVQIGVDIPARQGRFAQDSTIRTRKRRIISHMSMTEKRGARAKMISNRGVTPGVEEASRHTTPETHHVKSLSRPKDAEAKSPEQDHFPGKGAPAARDGMSGHRSKHREGFTHNHSNVASPFSMEPEEINDVEPGSLGAD